MGAFLVCGMFSGVSPYGLLLPRSIQGIWGGRRLGYELSWESEWMGADAGSAGVAGDDHFGTGMVAAV